DKMRIGIRRGLAGRVILGGALSVVSISAPAGAQASGGRLHGTLIATNMNDNTATVIDLGSQKTIATLPTGTAPHEVAVSHSGHWAVVSNYGGRDKPGNSLTVIDLEPKVPAVTRTIDLGEYQ